MTDPPSGSSHLLACAEPLSTLFLYLGDEGPLGPEGEASKHRAPVSLGVRDHVAQSRQGYPQGTCHWVGASGFFVFAKIWNFLCLRFWNCSLAKSSSEHVWVRTYRITDSPGTGATSDASLDPQSFGQGLVHSWLKLWLRYRHNGYAYFFSYCNTIWVALLSVF